MRSTSPGIAVVLCLLVGTVPAWGADEDSIPGLEAFWPVDGGPFRWLDLDGPLVAAGAGRRWVVSGRDGSPVAAGGFEQPVHRAVLVHGKLYFDQGSRIVSIVPGSLGSPETLNLSVRDGADLLVGSVHDFLFVVEQGRAVHLLAIPPPGAMGDHGLHAGPDRPAEISIVPFEFVAVAAAAYGRTVYLALEHDGVAVIDTNDPLAPRLEKVLPIPGPVTALAVNRHRLFVLGRGELAIYDLREEAPRQLRRLEAVSGTAMQLSGRLVYIAQPAGGLITLRDDSFAAVTHFVTLSNFAFSPQNITIEVGDTVQWDNTQGTHDADSCEIGQVGCSSNSTEVFDFGAPAAAPWTFSHTFTMAGPNPYGCTLHGGFGMVGSVTVNAPPIPAVPDGTGPSNPLRVAKLDSMGASLEIAFDDSTCAGAADTQIVGGFDSDLPASPGGTYGVAFSQCGCGTTSPCVWTTSPQPESARFIWFLMTATDGSVTEGSWGLDGAGVVRAGPGAGGSSEECGVTGRDLSGTCGQ